MDPSRRFTRVQSFLSPSRFPLCAYACSRARRAWILVTFHASPQGYHRRRAFACASFQKKPSAILVCCIAVLSNSEDQQRYFSRRLPPSPNPFRAAARRPAGARFRVAARSPSRPVAHAGHPDVRWQKKFG